MKPDPETLKNGRPLFHRELSKNTPGPDVYDVKRNTDIREVNTKRPCLFGHSFEHYRRTCDLQKGIKVFDYAANKSNPAPLYPNVENSKRRFPAFSQSKSRQNTLWDAERKRGLTEPSPLSYD